MNHRNSQQDALGFTRTASGALKARSYGRTTGADLRTALGLAPGDEVIRTGVVNGVRTGSSVGDGPVDARPGDTFVGGPKCQLASGFRSLFGSGSTPVPPTARSLDQHIAGLSDIGFGHVTPQRSAQGIRIRLKGFTLPGGSRTDLLLVLPPQFPQLPPIGFYLRGDAATGGLDLSHLFAHRAFHEAPNLSHEPEAWRWYCLIVERWDPARHTLAGFVGQISVQLANGVRAS
jgi:hypothetical protein